MKTTKQTWQSIHVCLFVILIGLIIVGIFSTRSIMQQSTPQKPREPSILELTFTIIETDCEKCVDPSDVPENLVKNLPNTKIKEVKKVKFGTPEAAELIEKYGIKRVPTIILEGLEQEIAPLRMVNGAQVLDDIPPPYVDVETKTTKGLIKVIRLVTPDCEECVDIGEIILQLQGIGAQIDKDRTIAVTLDEAQALIKKYDITSVPTLIFSKDILEYPEVIKVWDQVGTVEEDGMAVLRVVPPPYVNLTTGETSGKVTLTLLVDNTCNDCYDVSRHQELLERNFNVYFNTVNTIDVKSKEGAELVKKYDIKLIPTILMSKDTEAYKGLVSAWSSIGDQAEDGTFVFRKVDLLTGETYKNLETGEIINATQEN